MPLLHRRAFIRQKPPADLRPDEEVFLCKITHEIFRTYDEFFERTILCNSLVWSCALTGRAGLTYLEAMESERRAKQNLLSFPHSLLLPLLHLAALGCHGRFSDLCEDIYTFVKDRFFPGETIDVCVRGGARLVCEVLQVHSPHSSANGAPAANGQERPTDGDTIIISDSDDENSFQSPVQVNWRKKPLSPSIFKYTVRLKDQHSEPFIVKANQISRRKSTLSRDRLKLLFKHHCEHHSGTISLKPSSVTKYRLAEQTFSQFFPDQPPIFPFSPLSKGAGRRLPAQAGSSLLLAAEEKLKLLKQKEAMAATTNDRARLKREKEELQEAKRREREDREKLKEEHRRKFEEERLRRREEKERRKLEKEREREKLKEEKKKYAERLKLWNKPREDMECEDLKDLPSPVPVRTRLPAELFGDALMVLEFLRGFGEAFDLKDEFPDGISLEVLEEALVGSDPEGPLCELLFFFLSAIFQALDEEQEEVSVDQAEDLSEALDEDDAPSWALSAVSSLAAAWPQLHQGRSLKQLDLDSCTLSEILRLHIIASGVDVNHNNAKLRYQKQGGFTVMDDPCVELRLAEPALLKRLSWTAVYDLTPAEKLRILQALIGKLLTLSSSRDLIEDCVEEQRGARQELRELKAEQHRREREETARRVRLRKEEKLREQEQRMKERDIVNTAGEPEAPCCIEEEEQRDSPSSSSVKAKLEKNPNQQAENRLSCSLLEEEKVRELQERIHKAAACTGLLPLGRDRLYRRYWLLPSASALFVEDDCFGLTEDMLQPHPKPTQDTTANMDDEKEEPAKGSAGPSPAPSHTCSLPVNRPNQWSFYSSVEEVDQLIEALNPRGHRESALKEALLQERERLQLLLQQCNSRKYTYTDDPESSRSITKCTAAAESLMEVRLRDLLLDIEDRIHQGTLGTLKAMDRQLWRSALEAGNYELLVPEARNSTGVNGLVEPMEVDHAHLRVRERLRDLRGDGSATSGSGTPQVISSSIRVLAQALAHIEQGIERRFLKAPLGDDDFKKDQKLKKNKKKDEDQASDDGSDSGRVFKTVLERWRESLHSCSSLSQVFVHLSTLERSVVWSRSILNARCRVCRRKGDADNMLLCDGCDRGHHTHCLRPRLKSVPGGDWFCPDCRPKQRSTRQPSRQRSSIDEDEEEKEEESSEGEEDYEESEEEEESDEVQEAVFVSTKKSQALPLKTKTQQNTTPKSNTLSSGKNFSASKSSGKKATPPPTKANMSSGSKAPPRTGIRNSSRLKNDILGPANKKKPSPGQTESRRRTRADVDPPKPSRPVLSSSPSFSTSFSRRRSSGRNHGVHELSACEQLTVDLVRHEDSWPFMKLVSKTQVPDYYDIIKKPIALSTIREKVNNCDYQTAAEFVSDVDLMFSNCLQYNPRHTNEARAGQRLQHFFHSQLGRLGISEHDSGPASKRSRL